MNQIVKNVGMTVAGVFAGGWAAVSFAASHSVDLYAAYDQLNVVVAEVSKLVALVTPIGLGIYAAFTGTKKALTKVVDAMPGVAGVITANTPEGKALALSIPSPTVAPAGSRGAEAVARAR